MRIPHKPITRRSFVARSSAAVAGSMIAGHSLDAAQAAGPFQAMGTRAGEVTDTTAIVWTRLTAAPVRNNGGVVIPKRGKDEEKRGKSESKVNVPVEQLEGACPGAPGRVQLRYGTREDLSDAKVTEVAPASAENDFICHFRLGGLKPGTVYHYASEIPGAAKETTFRGKFETAPAADAPLVHPKTPSVCRSFNPIHSARLVPPMAAKVEYTQSCSAALSIVTRCPPIRAASASEATQ